MARKNDAATAKVDPPMQEDPSNPGRFVKHKKQNQAFLVHHKWKQEQAKKKAARGEDPNSPDPTISVGRILKWSLIVLISTLTMGHFITGDPLYGYDGKWRNPRKWIPVKQRVFTPAELALYNGRDTSRPTYVSVCSMIACRRETLVTDDLLCDFGAAGYPRECLRCISRRSDVSYRRQLRLLRWARCFQSIHHGMLQDPSHS